MRSFVLGAGALLLVAGCGDETTPAPDKAKAEEPKPDAKLAEDPKPDEAKPEAKDDSAEDEGDTEDDAADDGSDADDEGDTKTADAETDGAKTPAGTTPKPASEPEKKGPTGPTVGKTSTVVASVKADPGYKCNDAYPHKFVTAGGSNVKYPDPKPKGGCAGKHAISVPVPYIPTAAGSGSVSGTLRYGICDEAKTNCRVVKKQMSLPFTAAES